MKRAFVGELLALDRALKRIVYGGDDVTISEELGRRLKRGSARQAERLTCELLDLLDRGHCLHAGRDEDDDCDEDLEDD